MKTIHILAFITISSQLIPTSVVAQPAFISKPDAAQQRTMAAWQQVQHTAQLYQALPCLAPDPDFSQSYTPIYQRLRFIADRYAAIDLRGADEYLRQHVKEQIESHKAMAQAFRRAQTEFVPALQATLPELVKSDRASQLAKDHHFDLATASITNSTLDFIALLAKDRAFASESRWLAKQASLITLEAASFQQAEERMRSAHAAHERIATALTVKFGSSFISNVQVPGLWAW